MTPGVHANIQDPCRFLGFCVQPKVLDALPFPHLPIPFPVHQPSALPPICRQTVTAPPPTPLSEFVFRVVTISGGPLYPRLPPAPSLWLYTRPRGWELWGYAGGMKKSTRRPRERARSRARATSVGKGRVELRGVLAGEHEAPAAGEVTDEGAGGGAWELGDWHPMLIGGSGRA